MVKQKPTAASQERGSASDSFLVRIWREPRREGGEGEPVRGFVRNLRTGEEHYLGDPSLLLDHLVRGRSAKEEASEDRHEADVG